MELYTASISSGIISLKPRSLYITTQPLVNGHFHWGLAHTDSRSAATHHHWSDNSGGATVEGYSSDFIGRLNMNNSKDILAFFEVEGYSDVNDSTFMDICAGVFPDSYSTVKENQQHGITSQTWVFQVLDILQRRGGIVREGGLKDTEGKVLRRSQELETIYLETFLLQRSHVPPVLAV